MSSSSGDEWSLSSLLSDSEAEVGDPPPVPGLVAGAGGGTVPGPSSSPAGGDCCAPRKSVLAKILDDDDPTDLPVRQPLQLHAVLDDDEVMPSATKRQCQRSIPSRAIRPGGVSTSLPFNARRTLSRMDAAISTQVSAFEKVLGFCNDRALRVGEEMGRPGARPGYDTVRKESTDTQSSDGRKADTVVLVEPDSLNHWTLPATALPISPIGHVAHRISRNPSGTPSAKLAIGTAHW